MGYRTKSKLWILPRTPVSPTKTSSTRCGGIELGARRKAELYADAAGVALGPVVSVAEQAAAMPAPMGVLRARGPVVGAGPPPIAAGEDTLRGSVSVAFALGT
jgi:hypothetical protein